MGTYTTFADVSNELNGFTLNSTTIPTSTIVGSWITEASDFIDLKTGNIWGTATVSSEFHDYDGSGMMRVLHIPIISITSLLAESNGINAATESWYALSEGRTSNKDYYIYSDEGDIIFHGTKKPIFGYQNLCISYTYGYTTTPNYIKELCTKIVAKRVINSIVSGGSTSEGGSVSVGTISVSDPTVFGITNIKRLDNEIYQLFKDVGTFKTFRLTRNY